MGKTVKKILVADDEEPVRGLLKMILQLEGYYVRTAADGEEVLKMCRVEDFDLLITDIMMPKKEGVETILELKNINPGISIIAISGGGKQDGMDVLRAAEMVGAEHTLAKPFEPKDLVKAVERCLR